MNMRETPPEDGLESRAGGLHYAWLIVAAGFTAQMISSLSMQGLATYAAPLRHDFGWTSAQTAIGRSIQAVDSVLGPLSGWLVDRWGARIMMLSGVTMYLAAFSILGAMQSLGHFYVACMLMGLANSLLGLLIVSQLVNNWFVRKRSSAMGLAVAGFAVSGIVLLPLIVFAQDTFGWRATAFGTGALIFLIGMPIMLLVRSSPEEAGMSAYGAGASNASGASAASLGMGFRDALAAGSFWMSTGALTLATIHQAALIVHLFPYLEIIESRAMAGLLLALVNVFNLLGRVLGGVLGDAISKGRLLALGAFATSAGLGLVAVTETMPALIAFCLIEIWSPT